MSTQLQIPPIVTKIETFSITNEDTMEQAVTLLSLANKQLDKLTADKEKITKPINDALKEVNERYKPAQSRLKDGISQLRSMISTYQTEKTAAALLEAEKIAARVGTGKGKLLPGTASNQIAAIETPSERVKTEHGSVSFKTVKKFELVDISKVPMAYHLLNEAVIKELMKDGIEVEGVRYFTEEQPINRRS